MTEGFGGATGVIGVTASGASAFLTGSPSTVVLVGLSSASDWGTAGLTGISVGVSTIASGGGVGFTSARTELYGSLSARSVGAFGTTIGIDFKSTADAARGNSLSPVSLTSRARGSP